MESKKLTETKVFCIGWHKTGTSTIGMALINLGYEVLGARLDTTEALMQGDMKSLREIAAPFDALQDVPWNALYKELDQSFPESKFILTVRDEQKWLNSAAKHFSDSYIPMHKWLYGEGVLKGNEELYLDRYRQHNKEVLAYFNNRPGDFLILNFEKGDGWDKLCGFLDHKVPDKPFPHANKGKHSYNVKDKLMHQLRILTPDVVRKVVFQIKLALLKARGYNDTRNKFNNFPQNRNERAKWAKKYAGK